MEMDGANSLMDSSEAAISGFDNLPLFAGLPVSNFGLVSTSSDSPLTFSFTSLPLTLTTMAKDHGSHPDLSLAAQTLETLIRVSDVGAFSVSADALKSDPLTKQLFEEKGLSPMNVLSSSAFHDPGGSSPAPALQFRSAGNGGDTMLSAINYTDNEILADSTFDINNSGAPGLGQLDDNLFSGLTNPTQGQGSNFDLFDGGVSDPLSPFGDASLSMDNTSLPLDSERSADGVLEEAKPTMVKTSPSKKNQPQLPQQIVVSQADMGSPGKVSVPCPVCGKQFNNVSALAKHRLTHSDERKYLCTVCNKGFKRQDHLNGHQMTHLDKKPFGCPLENCDKGYCDARSLRRHLEAHHHLPQDVAQTHVAASMAASGITPPAQRNGKSKSAELVAAAKAAQAAQAAAAASSGVSSSSEAGVVNSPSYSSATSTPSPSQGSGNSQNPHFHFEMAANKTPPTTGNLAVKVESELGELGLKRLQEVAQQQQKHGALIQMKNPSSAPTTPSDLGQQPQFQVQFQLQQPPADLLALMQAQQLQLQLQQQQQLQQQADAKGNSKKSKAAKAKEAKAKAQELKTAANIGNGAGSDSGVSSQSDISWHDRAQVYNFVGTPGSTGDQSPASLSGEMSPNGVLPQASPGPMTPTTPSSPMQSGQRLSWTTTGVTDSPHQSSPTSKKKDKDDKGEGPMQCTVCEKRFKTLPALNGHMRLHGGYLKKEGEGKRSSRKNSTSSPTSTTSSPSTPTDMGPPPPPPRPAPPPLPAQHSPLPPQSPQQQPTSPCIQIPLLTSSTGQILSPQQAQGMGDLQGSLQTFFLTDSGTLNQLSVDVLQQQQQQQLLQRQLELQQQLQMAQKLKEKEEQDIRSLEEQLKQNIHEQQINNSLPPTPTTPQPPQPTALTLAQVNQTLVDVSQALSAPQGPSPLTEKEKIQQLVERFRQVEELHQQQQHSILQPLSQITAQQIQQLQQQHSQLGLPPLQPAQLQHMLQEQQQQLLQQQQQQLQQQQNQNIAGLHLNQGSQQLLINSTQGGLTQQSIQNLMMGLNVSSSSLVTSINSMTPGLPGGVLTTGQQLPLGSSGSMVVSSAAPTSMHGMTSNPVLTSAGLVTSSSLPNLISSSGVLSAHQLMGLSHQGGSEPATLSLSEHMGIQDPALSQLMGGFESVMASEMPQSHSAGFGDDLDSVSMFDQGINFHQNPFTSADSGSFSLPTGLDSIKEDVMLSSTVDSAPQQGMGGGHHLPSDRLLSGLDTANRTMAAKSSNNEIRRRLSGDIDLNRKMSTTGSLTITSLLNRAPALLAKKEESGGIGGSVFGNNPNPEPSRVRVRSKSGDIHKFMRSKSMDQSLMRQRSNTEESIYRSRKRSGDETFIGRAKSNEEYLSQSDGAGVFRNPGCLPSPFKIKRKNRPSPLFIPPTLSSFQSRLRSPRIWDGGDGKGGKGHTPPPYTPPPMLSPIRSGSGLFCSMQGTRPLTPQSAPISARLALSRRGSLLSSDSFSDAIAKEGDEEAAPETDIKPHVNIGSQYQCDLPPLNMNQRDSLYSPERADLLWEPSAMTYNTDDEVQSYQDFSCCSAVKGNGANVEYALHLLYLANGDIQKAMLMLMDDPPVLPPGHTLLTYKYQESDAWSASEIQMFHEGLIEADKDFYNVSRKIGTKSVKECIQFYYLWKKVCPDDYKRLRILRRKRNQNTLYNLRSQGEGGGNEPTPSTQGSVGQEEEEYYDDGESDSESQLAANGMMGDHGDFSIDVDLSSVTSSPANPPSLPPPGHEPNPLTLAMQGLGQPQNLVPVHPVGLQPMPNPVMTTVAAGFVPTQKVVPAPPPVQQHTFACDAPGCNAVLNSKQSLLRHQRKHTKEKERGHAHPAPPRSKPRPTTPSRSPVYDTNGEEIFPCKLCDRVFTKVKSRSAHMKSHKVAEPEKSKSPASSASPASSHGALGNLMPSPMSDL